MSYSLTDKEIINSLITNSKDRFIKKIDWSGSDYSEQDIIEFFKKHSNLENKVDWNSSPEEQKNSILKLIGETKTNKENKSNIKNLFKSDEFRILGEDDDYIYVAPLTWEACKFIDSYQCGGQGATWCIGYEQSDEYWNSYTSDGDVFVLMMKKPNARKGILTKLEPVLDFETEIEEVYDEESGEYYESEYLSTTVNGHDMENYRNDNKVMFQINWYYSDATAWEQADDFDFINANFKSIIRECKLGLEWNSRIAEELHEEIIERNQLEEEKRERMKQEADERVLVANANEVIFNFDEYQKYKNYLDIYSVRSELENRFKDIIKFVGKWDETTYFMLTRGWGWCNIDLSGVDFSNSEIDNFRIFHNVWNLDLSSLQPQNINADVDDMFDKGRDITLRKIVVNPNCTELIEELKEVKEQYGLNFEIQTRGHNDSQGFLDLGYDDGSKVEQTQDYWSNV